MQRPMNSSPSRKIVLLEYTTLDYVKIQEPSLGLSYVTTIVLQSIAATAYLDCFLRQENMFTGSNKGSLINNSSEDG